MKLSEGIYIISKSSSIDGESPFLLTKMLIEEDTFLQDQGVIVNSHLTTRC